MSSIKDKYLSLIADSKFPIDKNYDKNCLAKLKSADINKYSNCCLDLVRAYHPSIWQCNIKNHLAPVDA